MPRHDDIIAPQNFGQSDWDVAGDEFALVQSRINRGDTALRDRLLAIEKRERTIEQAAGEEWPDTDWR